MSHKNGGYQLGLLTRKKMREHGVEKSPLLKFGLNIGLGVASVLALGLEAAGKKCSHVEYNNDEPEDGYHESGPEGPGYYYAGRKIDDYDD